LSVITAQYSEEDGHFTGRISLIALWQEGTKKFGDLVLVLVYRIKELVRHTTTHEK